MTADSVDTPCANCGKPEPLHARGLCMGCYVYQQRHRGRPRPRYLWDPDRPCRTCGALLAKDRFHAIDGECQACYAYRRRTGRQRPERLYKRFVTSAS